MLKAGFAKYDITPRVGVQLYGFGAYLNRYSIGVRAPLEARAAVLEMAGKRIAVVGCDLCKVPEFMIRKIREQVGQRHPELLPDGLIISASHTHSGPAVIEEDRGWGAPDHPYLELLPVKIAEAVHLAAERLEPVTFSVGSAPCEHLGLNRVFDRDAPPLEEVLRDDWRPAKPELTDTVCRVLKFTGAAGELKGFMAYFGCHPVVCSASNRYIHGDYAGVAMQQLMREFPGSTGIFLQGAEGDVNSGCVHKPEGESLLALDVFAARFANSVRSALASAEKADAGTLKCRMKTFDFSTRKTFNEAHLQEMRKKFSEVLLDPELPDSDGRSRINTVYLRGAAKMMEALLQDKVTVKAEICAVRLGPVRLFGTPFEVMQGIKNEVMERITDGLPLVLSLCNGASGYAPSYEVAQADMDKAAGGGYEATIAPLISGQLPFEKIHDELVEAILELNRELEN